MTSSRIIRWRLSILAQPSAIVRGDESAKTRQARMVRRSRLQIGENLPQRLAHGRPIVGALPQHRPRMADRPAHGHIYEAVHRSARCLRRRHPRPRGGKYGAVDVKGRVSRSGAELVTLLRKVVDGFALGARANMGPSDGLARRAQTNGSAGCSRSTRARAGCNHVVG
jgi:hypothetical protein